MVARCVAVPSEALAVSLSALTIGAILSTALLIGPAATSLRPVVGALLVFSLMVGPASAARALTDRPLMAALSSVGLSVVTAWLSIALSYLSNWPVGFFVGAAGVISYMAERLYRQYRRATLDDPGTDGSGAGMAAGDMLY